MKKDYIVKETYLLTDSQKQELINYLQGIVIIEQQDLEGINYTKIYTKRKQSNECFTLLKNNQLVEPFNQYYQNLMKHSEEITDTNIYFQSKNIKELNLPSEIMNYLRNNYSQIKTVKDFTEQKYYLIDSYMNLIRNMLLVFEDITYLVVSKNKTQPKKLERDESDRKITQDFLSQSTLSKEEFDFLYWQVRLIHQAIKFSTLKLYSDFKLEDNKEQKNHDLIMELDNEEDGIYKQVKISPENMTTSIELCKKLKDGYFIAECIEFWSDYESYFSRRLFKINYPKKEEVISLAYKEWQYNGVKKTLEEMPSLDFTATTLSKSDKEYLEATPSEQKHYIRCLSKNKSKKINSN